MKKDSKAVLLSCLAAVGIAGTLAVAGRRQIAEWLAPPIEPGRGVVILDFEWDPDGIVRCETRPYLRPDGAWLETHEFSTVSGTEASRGVPDLREIKAYLELRQRDITPLFGEAGRLSVLLNYHREVPWSIVTATVDICTQLGITRVDLDSDD